MKNEPELEIILKFYNDRRLNEADGSPSPIVHSDFTILFPYVIEESQNQEKTETFGLLGNKRLFSESLLKMIRNTNVSSTTANTFMYNYLQRHHPELLQAKIEEICEATLEVPIETAYGRQNFVWAVGNGYRYLEIGKE
jgi:hypothetical protein